MFDGDGSSTVSSATPTDNLSWSSSAKGEWRESNGAVSRSDGFRSLLDEEAEVCCLHHADAALDQIALNTAVRPRLGELGQT